MPVVRRGFAHCREQCGPCTIWQPLGARCVIQILITCPNRRADIACAMICGFNVSEITSTTSWVRCPRSYTVLLCRHWRALQALTKIYDLLRKALTCVLEHFLFRLTMVNA